MRVNKIFNLDSLVNYLHNALPTNLLTYMNVKLIVKWRFSWMEILQLNHPHCPYFYHNLFTFNTNCPEMQFCFTHISFRILTCWKIYSDNFWRFQILLNKGDEIHQQIQSNYTDWLIGLCNSSWGMVAPTWMTLDKWANYNIKKKCRKEKLRKKYEVQQLPLFLESVSLLFWKIHRSTVNGFENEKCSSIVQGEEWRHYF